MNTKLVALGSALAAVILATSSTAATVTATFEGSTSMAFGEFLGNAGTPHRLTVTGEDDTPGSAVAAFPAFFDLGSGAATAYSITSMSYELPDLGRSFSSNSVTGYIGDNVARGTDTVDAIYIVGSFTEGSTTGLIEYAASFDQTTFGSTALSEAISAGIVSAQTILEGAGVSLFPVSAEASQTFGRISVTDVMIDPGQPGGGNGGGGGAPNPAPVPLPAGAPLLLAGLGALAWLRRRR